jgi:hypothetical protein
MYIHTFTVPYVRQSVLSIEVIFATSSEDHNVRFAWTSDWPNKSIKSHTRWTACAADAMPFPAPAPLNDAASNLPALNNAATF